jgi:hypothetical protein
MPDVTTQGSEELWIIQPLLDAGLRIDEVRHLLFRVSFDCMVGARPGDLSDPTPHLGPRPPQVRAAWIQTVGRMLGG